ncbi:MAG: hypothetical protein WCO89_08050 [Syntrophus sp. (in: bacteria)]
MKRRGARKCKHCRQLFLPDYRNRDRQEYCNRPACRQAHRSESQRRWLAKPENRNHFKGSENVDRVQRWREAHPGYWRRGRVALQDDCGTQTAAAKAVTPTETPLQDDCLKAHPLIVGLISHFSGALQDDIAPFMERLQTKGQMILGRGPGIEPKKETVHAGETSVVG